MNVVSVNTNFYKYYHNYLKHLIIHTLVFVRVNTWICDLVDSSRIEMRCPFLGALFLFAGFGDMDTPDGIGSSITTLELR